MSDYFELVDRSRASILGGFYAANAAQIKTGILVRIGSDRSLTRCAYNQAPDGFAEGLRQLVYAPTVLTLDAGEGANVISGKVLVRVDSSFFYNSTLPSEGDTIYAVNSGLMSTSGGVYKLGKCIKAGEQDDVYRYPPSTTASTVLLDLEVGGINTV